MKTIIIIGGSFVWSLLFYQQYIGINIFLFAILILLGLVALQRESFKAKTNLVFIGGLLLSSFFVFYYAAAFPMIMFVLSLIFIATLHLPSGISLITRPFITLIGTLEFWLVRWIEKLSVTSENVNTQDEMDKKAKGILKVVLLVIGSATVLVLFFLLYRDSNVVFKSITDKFEIDINPEFFGFTFLGIIVLNAIYNSTYFQKWINYEKSISDQSSDVKITEDNFQMKRNYVLSGLLFLLNILLLLINCIDMLYLVGAIELPGGIGHSEMVHQAVESVIFSIVVAMILLLFIYKNNPENSNVSKWMFRFALIWAFQNFLLLFTAFNKNYAYIEMHDLTYKRIGVMIYLLLALIGLAIVFIKLNYKKSNWYVIKRTSFSFYLILLACSCFNWPVIVTEYNLNKSLERGKIDDVEYLIDLDTRNLGLLSDFSKEHPELFKQEELLIIESKLNDFLETNHSWQSFNLSSYLLKNSIAKNPE